MNSVRKSNLSDLAPFDEGDYYKLKNHFVWSLSDYETNAQLSPKPRYQLSSYCALGFMLDIDSMSSVVDDTYVGFDTGLFVEKDDELYKPLDGEIEEFKTKEEDCAFTDLSYPKQGDFYDPRCRDWYVKALNSTTGNIVFDGPYVDFPTNGIVVTFSQQLHLHHEHYKGTGVLAKDISSEWDYFRDVKQLMAEEEIRYMLISDNGSLIYHSEMPQQIQGSPIEAEFADLLKDGVSKHTQDEMNFFKRILDEKKEQVTKFSKDSAAQ